MHNAWFTNTWLIAKREYLERIRARSFVIMTILIPALMGGLLFGSSILGGRGSSNSGSTIKVITQDARFGLDLKDELEDRKGSKIEVDVISPPGPNTRSDLDRELKSKDLDGYLWVTPAATSSSIAQGRATFEWVPRSKVSASLKGTIGDAVRAVLTREGLTHQGMGASDVDALMQQVDLDSSQSSKNDITDSATASAFGLFFLMYFVILFYGMNVARSIIEEKTSRIFEVLLATIRPEEMMAGKVLGVGAVGLTQVGIWLTAALLYAGTGLMASNMPFHLTAAQVIFFIIFFLLGYILYSSLAAALGAMNSSEQELQQMNIFLMLPLIACSTVIFRVVSDPDGTLARVFSFFPFCTPLIMYARIAVKQPPWYEIAGSIAGLVLTICAVLWFASRVYRIGILMYGKRPSLPEILRWVKYS
jgi:ABC-2 type transport system permease protein